MQVISWNHNYSIFNFPQSVKTLQERGELQKYLDNKKSILDEIKNTFHNSLKGFLLVKYKK